MSKMYQPVTVREALELLAAGDCMACAGGTNLYVDRKHGKYLDADYVSLDRLKELRSVHREADGIHIGSMVNFAQLEKLEFSGAECIPAAASMVGAPQIRNRGTIGGNIISASPAADMVPPLMALDAVLVLNSMDGERRIPVTNFMKGPGKTDLRPQELLTEIIVPVKEGRSVFYKAGKRNALAIAVCSQAVFARMEQGKVAEISVSYGSVGPTALRAAKLERCLIGSGRELLSSGEYREMLLEALQEDISPIDDIRATREYRQRVAFRMLLHNLNELWR